MLEIRRAAIIGSGQVAKAVSLRLLTKIEAIDRSFKVFPILTLFVSGEVPMLSSKPLERVTSIGVPPDV